MALSISHEVQRRSTSVIISTQELQEDERRRTALLNEDSRDIFDDSVGVAGEVDGGVDDEGGNVGSEEEAETEEEYMRAKPGRVFESQS